MRILACPEGEMDGNSAQFLLYKHIRYLDYVVEDYRKMNPFKAKYDIIHVHWPELFTNGRTIFHVMKKSLVFLSALSYQKIGGARIVWTCHDVVSHSAQFPLFEKLFMNVFIRLCDGIIIPLKSSMEYACRIYPQISQKPVTSIPTGHYIGIYPNLISQTEARTTLGIPAGNFVFAMIGNLGRYKGIEDLVKAFTSIDGQNNNLLLVGKVKEPGIREYLLQMTIHDPRIILHDRHIQNDDFQKYFNAADLVVLPYRKINNSGSLYLSLSFNKPTLVCDFPQMAEMKARFGNDYVLLYQGELTSDHLVNSTELIRGGNVRQVPDFSNLNFDLLAKMTANFMEEIRVK